jgi:hypothetical protein
MSLYARTSHQKPQWDTKDKVRTTVSKRPTQAYQNNTILPEHISKMTFDARADQLEKRKLYNRYTKFYDLVYEHLGEESDDEQVEKTLEKIELVKREKTSKKAIRGRKQLISRYRPLWDLSGLDARERKVKKRESPRKRKLRYTRTLKYWGSSIKGLSEDIPLEMAFRLTDIPQHIILDLMAQYGNQDYLQVFDVESEPAYFGSHDFKLVTEYRSLGAFSDKATAMATVDENLSTESIRVTKANENHLKQRGFQTALPEFDVTDAATRHYQSMHTKFQDTDDLREIAQAFSIPDQDLLFESRYDIPRWWRSQPRSRFMMDRWASYPKKWRDNDAQDIREGERLEERPSEKNSLSFDSKFLTQEGSMITSTIHRLVEDVLEKIFADTNGVEKKEVREFINNSNFHTGLYKTGNLPHNQELHVDEKRVLNLDVFQKALEGKYDDISPQEYMECGYVIEMPLSREGAYTRIAIPDSKDKVFNMEMIYVPFGHLIVKSMCLFNSGHYGSPGNTRFHATLHCSSGKPSPFFPPLQVVPAADPTPTGVETGDSIGLQTGDPTETPTGDTIGDPIETSTGVTTGIQTETPSEVPTAVPAEVPTEIPTETPTGLATGAATGATTGAAIGVATGVPTETPTGVTTGVPAEVTTAVTAATTAETPTEVPAEVATGPQTGVPTETETPTGVPTETETPIEVPAEVATGAQTGVPVETENQLLSNDIAFITDLIGQDRVSGWTIQWSELKGIPDPLKPASLLVRDYPRDLHYMLDNECDSLAKLRTEGTSQWNNLLEWKFDQRDTMIWMLNPSPPPMKKRKWVPEDDVANDVADADIDENDEGNGDAGDNSADEDNGDASDRSNGIAGDEGNDESNGDSGDGSPYEGSGDDDDVASGQGSGDAGDPVDDGSDV